MPILHIQMQGQAELPDGSSVDVHPGDILTSRGPCVQVTVTVEQSIAQQLLQQGNTLPPPISGLALIDTGASGTCIDNDVALQLQLPVIDVVSMASASHASTQQNVYPISIEVVGLPITINAPRAVGVALQSQGLIVLIGRDLLRLCTLNYNGVSGGFTLAI